MVFTPRPRISIQLRMSSYAQIHNLRWFKILQARIFHELLRTFLSPEGTGMKEGNEQDFYSYYMINHLTNKGFIISLLLGIFFSNMRPRSDNHPPPTVLPSHFLIIESQIQIVSQIQGKSDSTATLFYNFSTFNNSAISTADQLIYFYTKFFYLHVLAEFLYLLSIILILCPISEVT